MNIVGFLQNKNGVANGDLSRALTSMYQICNSIVVYDDASTEEGVGETYRHFDCVVIYGQSNNFERELFLKNQLLRIAMLEHPEWICWFDSDAVLGAFFDDKDRTVNLLNSADADGSLLLGLHNVNLWRSPVHYRVDQRFNDLWHGVFWRNTGELNYRPRAGLHQKQYPFFRHDQEHPLQPMPVQEETAQLLHYGFATDESIAEKYFRYRSHGQSGWPLDRLVDESTLELLPAYIDWFPKFLRDDLKNRGFIEPKPVFDPVEMSKLTGVPQWLEGRNNDGD